MLFYHVLQNTSMALYDFGHVILRCVTIHSQFIGTLNKTELLLRPIGSILFLFQGGDEEKISATE